MDGNEEAFAPPPFEASQKDLNRSALDQADILSGAYWAELRVFLAVAKSRSFNRAAEILNTSHPTVSRQVRRLQDVLGSQLVVSTRQGIHLTRKGTELARALADLDHKLFGLANDLKSERRETAGLVRFSITDGLGTFFLAPALREFSRIHPNVQISVRTPRNLVDTREEQADITIGFVPPVASEFVTVPLGRLHLIPVASRPYIDAHGVPTRSTIENHVFLQSEMYAAKTGLWDGWQQLIARGRIAHLSDNPMIYGFMVKAGLGIGLLGNYTVVEPTAVPLDLGVRIAVPMYLSAMRDRLQARPTRVTFDWAAQIFASDTYWFGDRLRLRASEDEQSQGIRLMFNC